MINDNINITGYVQNSESNNKNIDDYNKHTNMYNRIEGK